MDSRVHIISVLQTLDYIAPASSQDLFSRFLSIRGASAEVCPGIHWDIYQQIFINGSGKKLGPRLAHPGETKTRAGTGPDTLPHLTNQNYL